MREGRSILAVALGVGPIYAFAIVSHLTKDRAYTLTEMMGYPLVAGGANIVLILVLLRFLCREPLRALNPGRGRIVTDLGIGVALSIVLLVLKLGMDPILGRFLPREAPTPEILDLIRGIAASPPLLVLWFGPVVWIGVAGFEELSRAFLLGRLFRVWPTPAGRWGVVVLSSVLFGVAHLYQGAQGLASVSILSLVVGWYYMRFGRIWPLIVAHALYDSIQLAFAVVAIRSM